MARRLSTRVPSLGAGAPLASSGIAGSVTMRQSRFR
jgi:hypothetical protein